jgi:hypothetical protein
MRIKSKFVIAVVATLVVATTTGCSEASSGATLKSQRALIERWSAQVLADIGTTTVLAHSATPTVYDACGDWSSRYALTSLTVTVSPYKLQSAAKAIIDGQRARGWDTSAARINVGQTGNLTGGTILPAGARPHAAMTITGGPSAGEADLQVTITGDCFAG